LYRNTGVRTSHEADAMKNESSPEPDRISRVHLVCYAIVIYE